MKIAVMMAPIVRFIEIALFIIAKPLAIYLDW